MNSEILRPINTFVDTMIESKKMFEDVQVQISQKDAAVTRCIDDFRSGVSSLLSTGLDTQDEELYRLYESTQKSLQELLSGVAEDMRRTQKGTEFIRKYEQSFNVAVFGKVKAGKSYLGNFIMGNRIRDTGLKTSFDKLERPIVEVYDRGNVSTAKKIAEIDPEGKGELPEDANECTSAIQLFRLGGMTWFDTPGTGSITKANEMLAKDYVDNADLVVFTCNSDAAGTRQDFADMKALHEKGKPFLLLLTQSDTLEEDCDEAGELISVLVAKSAKDRADTEQYMVGELQRNGIRLKQGELLTISAKLAMEALRSGDSVRFQDSHMDQFLQVLTNITRTEGAELKRKTPNDRINATIGDIAKRLDKVLEELATLKKALLEKQRHLSTHGDLLLSQMQQECLMRTDALIRQKVRDVEQNKSAVTPEELGALLSQEIYQVLLRTCASEFTLSGKEILANYKVSMEGISGIEQKKETIEYEIQTVNWVERDPEGIVENLSSLFGKTYYRAERGTKTMTHEIDLGVNEHQTITLAHDQLNKLFQTEVPGLMKKISDQYLSQVSKLLDASSTQIQRTRQELEKLRC